MTERLNFLDWTKQLRFKKKKLVFSTNEWLRYSKDSESSAKNKNNAIFEIFYFTVFPSFEAITFEKKFKNKYVGSSSWEGKQYTAFQNCTSSQILVQYTLSRGESYTV